MNILEANILAEQAQAEFESQYPGAHSVVWRDRVHDRCVQLFVPVGRQGEVFTLYSPGDLARVRAKLLRREMEVIR